MKKPKSKHLKTLRSRVRRLSYWRRGFRLPAQKGGTLTNDGLPRITNETVAAHREQVLGSARKYIYPLQHSRHRIVKTSAVLFGAAVLLFFAYCGLALYRFQSDSTFIYEVTRVVPFPVAQVGSRFVAYENYLFELRHYVHYYQTQAKLDPNSPDGKLQINAYKRQALQQVIDDAFVKQLAARNGVRVTSQDVNNEVELVKSENRLGSSNQMLADVLHQFWGWSIDDFKRELATQLLAQKVASKLDTAAHQRADSALAALQHGASFSTVAAQVSDDTTTKANGGKYGFDISRTNRDIPPQVVAALFALKPGQISGIIDTGYTLEIVKLLQVNGDKVQAAHIAININSVNTYIAPLQRAEKTRRFIHP